jgi:hypothetical protein
MLNKSIAISDKLLFYKNLHWFFAALAFVLYFQTINFSYNFDDELVTINHPKTSKGLAGIKEIFTKPYYEDDAGFAYEYRPITLLSFAIEKEFLGENAKTSHLINLIIYSLTCLVLFKLLNSIFKSQNPLFPILITILFVVYPLHTEVVASIKNRDELLSLFWGLLAFHFFLKETSTKNILIGVFFFLLAMLSKQSIITLAILIPLSQIFFRNSRLKHVLICSLLLWLVVFLFNPANNQYFIIGLFVINICVLSIIYFIQNNGLGNMNISFTEKVPKTVIEESKEKAPILSRLWNFDFREIEREQFFYLRFKYSNINLIVFYLSITVSLFFFVVGENVVGLFLSIFPIAIYSFESKISEKIQHVLFFFAYLSIVGILFRLVAFLELGYALIIISLINKKGVFSKISTGFIIILLLAFLNSSHNFKLLSGFYDALNNFDATAAFFISILVFVTYIGKNLNINIRRFILLFFVVVCVAGILRLSFSTIFKLSIFNYIFFLIFVLSLIVFELRKYINLIFFILIAAVLFFEIKSDYNNIKYEYNTSQVELKVLEIKNINNIVLNEQHRPLKHFETPLKPNSPLKDKISTGLFILGEYAKLHVIPYPMRFYYGYAVITPVDFNNSKVIISIILHLFLIIILLYCFIKEKIISFAILSYLLSMLVFSNIIEVIPGIMADRFTYFSSLWFIVIICFCLFKLFNIDINKNDFKVSKFFVIILTMIFTAYSGLTIARTSKWKNHLSLMLNDIKHLEKSAGANNFLAIQLAIFSSITESTSKSDSLLKEAAFYFNRASLIDSTYFNPAYDLGRVNLFLGNNLEAKKAFERAYFAEPDNLLILLELGKLSFELNDFNDCIRYLSQYLEKYKLNEESHYLYIESLIKMNQKEIALKKAVEALKYFPNSKPISKQIYLLSTE